MARHDPIAAATTGFQAVLMMLTSCTHTDVYGFGTDAKAGEGLFAFGELLSPCLSV